MTLTILGNNICGIMSKKDSLVSNLENFKTGIFTLQETKLTSKGLIKIPNYVIFEVLRNGKEGGSIMTGIHENLNPVFIFEDINLEILVIQIRIANISIRIINAYGPQEYAGNEKILRFYSTLDQVFQNAKFDDCLIVCQLDANAKVGFNIIQGDPYPQSPNGQILMDLIERNDLMLCNATDKCNGLITRRRITKNKKEESIIDYLIVCQEMYQYLECMNIDQNHIHSRYIKRKNNIQVIPSDHLPIFGRFSLKWNSNLKLDKERRTIYNFKDKEGLLKYKKLTSKSYLSSQFGSGCVLEESRSWLKSLKNILCQSFPIVRVGNGSYFNKTHEKMVQKSKFLAKIEDLKKSQSVNQKVQVESILKLQEKIDIIDLEIATLISEKNAQKIKDHYSNMTDFGSFNVIKM